MARDRYIILDVDGVLNTYPVSCNAEDERCLSQIDWHASRIKAEHMAVLNQILEETESVVVVSSAMRKLFDVEELQKIFEKAGFTGQIIGKISGSRNGWRGEEVETWMKSCGVKREHCVILEDEPVYMETVFDRLVYVNNKTGLQESHIEVVKYLFDPYHPIKQLGSLLNAIDLNPLDKDHYL